MEKKSAYLSFVPSIKTEDKIERDALWFIRCEGKLIVKNDKEGLEVIPRTEETCIINKEESNSIYLGRYMGVQCYCMEIKESAIKAEELELNNFALKDLRSLLPVLDEEEFMLCGRAVQILDWDINHQYCSKCGSKNKDKVGERAKQCISCGQLYYPRISPAIIVAVVKEGKILLAHNKNFRNDVYSVIAGFLEPGENFEQCVMREVLEETGIKTKNIKYFGSQPWPFPNSLMVAFTAEYLDGDVKPDGVEIDSAGWFQKNELPSIPGKGSVARKLIDWFLNKEIDR